MISEQEVLESLDHLGEKLRTLREENRVIKEDYEEVLKSNQLLNEKDEKLCDENNALKIEIDEKSKENDEVKNALVEVSKKYENAMTVVRRLAEDTIEKQLEPQIEQLKTENKTLGERVLQLQKDKGDLLDQVRKLTSEISQLKSSLNEKTISIDEISKRIKGLNDSELDIDTMITKIHTTDVKTSAVDEKLKEIKSERFTNQYSWGRATKETEKKFVDFVTRLWSGSAIVGNYKVLNKISDTRSDLDDNTMNSFLRFLLNEHIIENRDNGEIISSYELPYVISVITKKC